MSTILMVQAPLSVAVKTAGYTIPANRVARCTVNLEGSATFTIDGTTALRSTQNTVLGGSSLKDTGTAGQLSTNSPTGTTSVFTASTDQKTIVHTVTLPAGTLIGGTGTFRVVVEEYPA